MILSSDYEDILPICVQDEEENKSTLILTLFLLEEEQKENSFFKPYIDLFPEQDYIIFWDEKYLKEMDNEKIILSAHFLYYEIYQTNVDFRHCSDTYRADVQLLNPTCR